MPSINKIDVEAYRNVAEKFTEELNALVLQESPLLSQITSHDNVKGKLITTQMFTQNFGRRYSKDFNPPVDTVELKPNVLEVEAGKFEFSVFPQDFENSYRAYMDRGKFRDVEEFPEQAFILGEVAKRQRREIVEALIHGVKAATPADSDTLEMLFDGYLKQIADAITAATLTPTVVPGGAYTKDNIIDSFEEQVDNLSEDYISDGGLAIICNPKIGRMYMRAYRDELRRGAENVRAGVVELDFLDARLIMEPRMRTSNRVIMTPMSNLEVGYDSMMDVTDWHMDQVKRKIDFYSDFKFGCRFNFLLPDMVSVNDLA